MQLMNQPTSQPITAFVLDRILAFLAPLFLEAAEGNLQAARCAAAETLQAYAARSEQELSLAAQVIAFSLRALDALARAAAADLDIRTILRLNASAATLHRAAMRAQKELDRLRAQPVPSQLQPTAEPPALLAFADATRRALSPATPSAGMPEAESLPPTSTPPTSTPYAATPHAATPSGPALNDPPPAAPGPVTAPSLSRQQRRLAERLAKRERRHQPDHVRQVERSMQNPQNLEAALLA